MELVIITGMSGAGKSNAMNAMEDLGFYCVDNLPPRLLGKFLELCAASPNEMGRVAIAIDVRGREMLRDLESCLEEAKREGHTYHLMFLDCKDETIIRRYKETRRVHPLMTGDRITIEEALMQERLLLEPARRRADYYIDTSLLKAGQLKGRVASLFSGNSKAMVVQCMSFGFKHGIPPEADFVLDLRSLPNPFYVEELKNHTGMDQPVYDYVFGHEDSRKLYAKLVDMATMLAELAAAEGRSQFTLAMGCTGGHHRSVSFTRRLGAELGEAGFNVRTIHRDIDK